jgi:hypothetical protein
MLLFQHRTRFKPHCCTVIQYGPNGFIHGVKEDIMNHKTPISIIVGLILLSGCISSSTDQEPVAAYIEEKGISEKIVDSLRILEHDGNLDEHEKKFIDALAGLPEPVQEAIVNSVMLQDGTIDNFELEFLHISLLMNDLILAVYQSNISQYTIDSESITHLTDIREMAKTNTAGAKFILENYYPELEVPDDLSGRAMAIHENAWEMVINRAKEDGSYKYSTYVSRSLAVKHSEVYLQADGVFVTIITTNRGFKKVYDTKDVHSKDLYSRTYETPPFSFEYVDFSADNIVMSKEYYPEEYPVLPFLDRRLLPIASTLKSAENTLTQLEKGVQMYFSSKNEENKEMYLIYCDNENTYLFCDGDIVWMKTAESVETVEGNPVLIFNEQYVWYPLMGRDDSNRSEILKNLVAIYTTGAVIPPLNDFEKSIVEELAQVTALSDSEIDRAVISSLRPVWGLKEYKVDIPGDIVIDACYASRPSLKHANFLSPITAYLVAVSEAFEGEKRIIATSQEYLEHTTTPQNWFMAHGHTWLCELVE